MRRISILIPLLFLAGCSREKAPSAATPSPEPLPSVTVAKAARRDLRREVELTADFRAYQEVEVHAKIAGFLKNIRVDIGDRVQKGQVIAELEAPEMIQELAQAASAAKRATLDIRRAMSEVTRAEAARNIRDVSYRRIANVARTRPNLVAQQEVDDSAARLQEAEAQVATAKATLASIEEQVQVATANRERITLMMNYLTISAPFSGMVTKRYADPGAMIQAGTASQSQARPVIRLSQVDRLRMTLPIPEATVPLVRTGMPVEIRVDSLSQIFQGTVARISGRLEQTTRTMDTEVDVGNPAGVLKPGMYAYATLLLEHKSNALAIPGSSAPAAAAEQSLSLVNSSNVIEVRKVRLGIRSDDFVEVVSGLAEGEMVIVSGGSNWKPGQKVEPRTAAN